MSDVMGYLSLADNIEGKVKVKTRKKCVKC